MAAKSRVSRLESEIDKARGDSNWNKALDLAKQVSSKLELLARFINAEAKLERYLLENPPNEKNIPKAVSELKPIYREFEEILGCEPKLGMKQECVLLCGKIRYATGDYNGTLGMLDSVGLDNLNMDNVAGRKLKIVGEAYAIKGMCLEAIPPSSTSKFKIAEREEQIIKSFERSGDLSLYHLQEKQEKGTKGATVANVQTGGMWNILDSDTTGVGPIVETAIQRSPILYIRNGELSKGIGRFRELLQAVETRGVQGLRMTLARQLAEVLLRGVSEEMYESFKLNHSQSSTSQAKHFSPKKYFGEELFYPTDQNEETLLLLLIAESIATREAVLNRSPEHKEARMHTFHNTAAVYDLLTISLVKRNQFSMLSETFERAMRFSFEEFHIWYQFALSLICSEKYSRAFLVLKECLVLEPKNCVVLLQAAKLCYENLHMVDEGIEYSKRVCDLEDDNPLAAKGYLSLGLGYSLKADEARLLVKRQDFQRKALSSFLRASALDTNDHLALFHVALQRAHVRQIPEAMRDVKRAIRLRCDHLQSLHLLSLLLSAQKTYDEALDLIDNTLEEYPDNFSLLFTKCKLEEKVHGVEEALQTCKRMLKLWKDLFEVALEKEQRGTGLLERITSTEHRSLVQLQLSELSDRDSGSPKRHFSLDGTGPTLLVPSNMGSCGSMRAESMAASRVEQALSEVASSLGSSMQPKQGPQQTWSLQTQIWLLLAELYLGIDKLDAAHMCVQEASSIFPISHQVSYMRGRIHEAKGELHDAKSCYENAAAINPSHIKSLQHLGNVLHQLGNLRMAEKVLRDSVNFDPTSSQSWHILGTVLESLDDFDSASECLLTSVQLEATNPIVPFSSIPRLMQ